MTQPSAYTRRARLAMFWFAASFLILTLGTPRASADTFTSTLSNSTLGSGFPGRFGTVTVTTTGPNTNTATVTFTANETSVNGGDFYDFKIGNQAEDLNVNATSFTASGFTGTVGFCCQAPGNGVTITAPTPTGPVPGFGNFNLQTQQSGTLAGSVTFTLTNDSGTWASAANVLTANNDGNDAAAHIQAFLVSGDPDPAGHDCYAGESAGSVVPEPASMLLFGTGLVALGVKLHRRKRNPVAA